MACSTVRDWHEFSIHVSEEGTANGNAWALPAQRRTEKIGIA